MNQWNSEFVEVVALSNTDGTLQEQATTNLPGQVGEYQHFVSPLLLSLSSCLSHVPFFLGPHSDLGLYDEFVKLSIKFPGLF
jgi:hypothetical protein